MRRTAARLLVYDPASRALGLACGCSAAAEGGAAVGDAGDGSGRGHDDPDDGDGRRPRRRPGRRPTGRRRRRRPRRRRRHAPPGRSGRGQAGLPRRRGLRRAATRWRTRARAATSARTSTTSMPSYDKVVTQVTNGGGAMPPFKDTLTAAADRRRRGVRLLGRGQVAHAARRSPRPPFLDSTS